MPFGGLNAKLHVASRRPALQCRDDSQAIDRRGKWSECDAERGGDFDLEIGEAAAGRVQSEIDQFQFERSGGQRRDGKAHAQAGAVDEAQRPGFVGFRHDVEGDADPVAQNHLEEAVGRLDRGHRVVRREAQQRLAVFQLQRDAQLTDRNRDASLVVADDEGAARFLARQLEPEGVVVAHLCGARRRHRHQDVDIGRARESERDVRAVDRFGFVDRQRQARLDRGWRRDVELDAAAEARADGSRHLQRQLGLAGKVRQRLLDQRGRTGEGSRERAIDEAADEESDDAERRLSVGDIAGGGGAEERRQLVGFVRRSRIRLSVAAQHHENLADRQRSRIAGRRVECPQTLDLLEDGVDDRERGRKSAATGGGDRLLHVAQCHQRFADNRGGNSQ